MIDGLLLRKDSSLHHIAHRYDACQSPVIKHRQVTDVILSH